MTSILSFVLIVQGLECLRLSLKFIQIFPEKLRLKDNGRTLNELGAEDFKITGIIFILVWMYHVQISLQ